MSKFANSLFYLEKREENGKRYGDNSKEGQMNAIVNQVVIPAKQLGRFIWK